MHPATARQLVGFGVVAAVAIAAFLTTDPEVVAEHAETLAARPALLAVVLFVLYLVRPLFAWPISVLSVLLGYLFGPIAIPVALAGAVLTTLPAYFLATYLGHNRGVLARVGDAGELLRKTTGDLRGVMVVRLAPLPTDPASYVVGLAGVPLRPYVVGTAVGEAPWVVTAVLLGAAADQLTAVDHAVDPLLVATLTALAALLALSRPVFNRLLDTSAA